jgi:hypothetical protein
MSKDTLGHACFICAHVLNQNQPIRFACRQEPLEVADSGWEFHCGVAIHSDEQLKVVGISTAITIDATLNQIISKAWPCAFERSEGGDPWTTDRTTLERLLE